MSSQPLDVIPDVLARGLLSPFALLARSVRGGHTLTSADPALARVRGRLSLSFDLTSYTQPLSTLSRRRTLTSPSRSGNSPHVPRVCAQTAGMLCRKEVLPRMAHAPGAALSSLSLCAGQQRLKQSGCAFRRRLTPCREIREHLLCVVARQ